MRPDLRAPRFFWIDNDAEEIDRSLLRIGIAYERGCPIFIAFATDELYDRFIYDLHLITDVDNMVVMSSPVFARHAFNLWCKQLCNA